MNLFVDWLDNLPDNNAIAVGAMLNQLSEDNIGFLEDHLKTGSELPGNIIKHINLAFKDAGFPQYTWENYYFDTRVKRFDSWLDEVHI